MSDAPPALAPPPQGGPPPTLDATAAAPAAPAAAPNAGVADDAAWEPLDPRVVAVWRLEVGLGVGVLVLGLLAATALLPGGLPRVAGAATATLALLLGAAYAHRAPARRYAATRYRFGEQDVRRRAGVWWQVLQVVPRARIEHVETRVGPLERRAGLATLVVHTAGTANAHVDFPGLDVAAADAWRERLARGAAAHDA